MLSMRKGMTTVGKPDGSHMGSTRVQEKCTIAQRIALLRGIPAPEAAEEGRPPEQASLPPPPDADSSTRSETWPGRSTMRWPSPKRLVPAHRCAVRFDTQVLTCNVNCRSGRVPAAGCDGGELHHTCVSS